MVEDRPLCVQFWDWGTYAVSKHASALFWFHFTSVVWFGVCKPCVHIFMSLRTIYCQLAWTLKYASSFRKTTNYLPHRQGNRGHWAHLLHNFKLPFWVLTSPSSQSDVLFRQIWLRGRKAKTCWKLLAARLLHELAFGAKMTRIRAGRVEGTYKEPILLCL